jgi:hypothetical protein
MREANLSISKQSKNKEVTVYRHHERTEDAADLLVPPPEEGFGVRRPLRETNWLYCSDSLRPHHVFEAVTFFGVAEHLLSLYTFFIYGASIATYSQRLFVNGLRALSTSARTLAFVSFTVASWLLTESTTSPKFSRERSKNGTRH